MHSLYLVTIYPIELLLSTIFSLLVETTRSYGIAIILLSIVVNTILIPLYHLADKWRRKEKSHQTMMAPDILAIKKHSKGQEKYYSLKAAYRIYHYNPLLALRVTLGLLIQIPFFIAAYRLLSHYEGIENVSFLFFHNLAKPDGFLWGINILPILMTVINLYNGLIYSKTIDRQELTQAWLLAFAFFIVLYNAPSVLVLYWTCNNIYSTIKYHILHRPRISKISFEVILIIKHILSKPILYRIIVCCWISAVLSLMLYITHHVRSIPSGSNAIKTSLLFFMMPTPFLVMMMYKYPPLLHTSLVKKLSVDKFYLNYRVWILSVILIISMLVDMVLIVDLISHSYIIGTSNRLKQMLELKYIVQTMFLFTSWYKSYKACTHDNFHSTTIKKRYYVLQSSILVLLVFMASPVLIYISASNEIGGTFTQILTYYFPYMLVGFLGLNLVYLIWWRARYVLSSAVLVLILMVFTYAFIINLHLGKVSNWRFDNIAPLEISLSTQLLEMFIWTGIFLLVYHFYKVYYFHINIMITAMCITLFIYTGFAITEYLVLEQSNIQESQQDDSHQAADLPDYNNALMSFSTERNVFVYILDAAMGHKFQKVLDEHPDLKSRLDGFTWYRNTVSVAQGTYESLAAMLRGQEYRVDNFSKRNRKLIEENKSPIPYGEVVFNGWADFGRKLPNYNVALMAPPDNLNYAKLAEEGSLIVGKESDYLEYWKNIDENREKYSQLSNTFFNVQYLTLLSVFRIAPVHIKQRLYNDQHPEFIVRSIDVQYMQDIFFTHWPFLDLLPSIANKESTQPTLKYFWALTTHYPFFFKTDCETVEIEAAWNGTHNTWGYEEGKMQTYCSLNKMADLFDWMKQENIYDNTKIIIASDHGGAANYQDWAMYAIYALLLVKDYAERGALHISDLLMSNGDIPSILASGIPDNNFNFGNNPITSQKKRAVFYNIGKNYWLGYKNDKNIIYELKYQIKLETGDNVYNKDDWEYVYPQQVIKGNAY